MKKQEIIDFLKTNEDWVLQYCRGIRDDGWWWLRNTKNVIKTIKVNSNSARAASKVLVRLSSDFDHTNYGL